MELEEGGHIYADTVLSNATAHTTFLGLLPGDVLPPEFEASIRGIDYSSPVCKINGAFLMRYVCVCVFLPICYLYVTPTASLQAYRPTPSQLAYFVFFLLSYSFLSVCSSYTLTVFSLSALLTFSCFFPTPSQLPSSPCQISRLTPAAAAAASCPTTAAPSTSTARGQSCWMRLTRRHSRASSQTSRPTQSCQKLIFLF